LRRQSDQYRTTEDREALLVKLEGKSKRECERILNPDQTGTPIRFLADDQTLDDLERLSQCLRIPRSNMSALIRRVCRIARKGVDPEMRKTKTKSVAASTPPVEQSVSGRTSSSYIRACDKRTVHSQYAGQCAFVDSNTGRRCQRRFGLEYDHIVPVSHGGKNSPENLRLLCKAHHYLVTVRLFGKEKIEGYVKCR